MSWEGLHKAGLQQYKERNYAEAVALFTEAIANGGEKERVLYDVRAAAYEKLGDIKLGLLDARKVIGLFPDQWTGYGRAARLFASAKRYDEAVKMADRAIARIPVGDTARRKSIATLKAYALNQQRRVQDHTARLPVEILDEVFRLLVDADYTTLLPLLGVSTRWRGVAESTPSLWAVLSLHNRKPAWKLRRWVAHSHNRIRELRLAPTLSHTLDWSFDELAVLEWAHLRVLRFDSWDALAFLERTGKKSALKYLTEVDITDEDRAPDRGPLLSEISHIQTLTLRDVRVTRALLRGLNALHSLEHLELQISHIATRSIVELCASNPSLRTLKIECGSPSMRQADEPTDLHILPQLTRLELAGPVSINIVLERLQLPALQFLSITREITQIDGALRRILEDAEIQSAGCTALTYLAIQSCAVDKSIFTLLLRASPDLHTLELRGVADVANFVLENLEVPRPGRRTRSEVALCPKLRRVVVANCPDVKTGPVLRMVGSRMSCPSSVPSAVDLGTGTGATTTPNAASQGQQQVLGRVPESDPSTESVAEGRQFAGSATARIKELVLDGCPEIEAEHLPWLKERVKHVSCVYLSKKAAGWKR